MSEQKFSLTSAALALALAAALGLGSGSQASVLDPREIQLLAQSSITDIDSMILGAYFNPGVGAALTYESTTSRLGWSGRLFGQYGPNAIEVVYTGVLTPLDALGEDYQIDYTSAWNVNGVAASGSGSGIAQDPFGTVSIQIDNMQASGSITYNTGVASVTISALKDFENKKFTASGTVGLITIPLTSASLIDGTLEFNYDQVTGRYDSSAFATYLFGLFEGDRHIVNEGVIHTELEEGFVVPPECVEQEWCNPSMDVPVLPGVNVGRTVTAAVPEPATWALMIMGFGLAGAAIRNRRSVDA